MDTLLLLQHLGEASVATLQLQAETLDVSNKVRSYVGLPKVCFEN